MPEEGWYRWRATQWVVATSLVKAPDNSCVQSLFNVFPLIQCKSTVYVRMEERINGLTSDVNLENGSFD